MAKERFHPEERLLKIIEKSGAEPGGVNRDIERQKRQIGLKRWLVFLKDFRLSKMQLAVPAPDLPFAKKALIGLSVILTVFFTIDVIKGKISLRREFNSVAQAPVMKVRKVWDEGVFQEDISSVLKQAEDRNIFSLEKQVSKGTQPGPVQTAKLTAASLKLVGILWSKRPQAMIEDAETKKTHLVSAGEQISGWTVKKIYKDRVVLSSEQGTTELR